MAAAYVDKTNDKYSAELSVCRIEYKELLPEINKIAATAANREASKQQTFKFSLSMLA